MTLNNFARTPIIMFDKTSDRTLSAPHTNSIPALQEDIYYCFILLQIIIIIITLGEQENQPHSPKGTLKLSFCCSTLDENSFRPQSGLNP